MSTSMGIVGLPNVGKSTIFNALTESSAQVANYPFTTIDANVGIVEVPDETLQRIAEYTKPEKITPATVEFIDIAGLVEGASRGEGLGNQFLARIREVDALCHILRGFEGSDVVHVSGMLSPVDDIKVLDTEFRLADLDVIQKRIEKTRKRAKGGDREDREELDLLEKIHDSISNEQGLFDLDLGERGSSILEELFLLSVKPVLFVLNIAEEYAAHPEEVPLYGPVREYVERTGAGLIAVSGKIEAELCGLPPSERISFYQELGLKESALTQLIKISRELLGLLTFYTIKGNETRAWHVRTGTTAAEAAGKIHSDMEKGFIKVEVVRAADFIRCGSMAKAREEGVVLIEGRDYIVQNGDVLLVRFKT